MFRKLILLVGAFALLLAFASCKKKEEQPAQQMGPQAPSINLPQGEPQVTVPENVKNSWDKVVLVVEDKTTGKSSEETVKIGSDYKIPGSEMRIHVIDFLPDFKMSGTEITSVSNEPNNPAARVDVFDGDKQIFRGWLYARFPAIHPFQNDKYGITLKEGVKKG
ncbi:MAG: DUF2155 domain-containing protein [Nitrospiraceae bacterium]|nr:DUF2155 domain-containing protein [Nitrospiraceae bacterium]